MKFMIIKVYKLLISADGYENNTTCNLNNCASHSRYFSDELDAQIFYKKPKQMFTKRDAYGII